MVEPEPESFAQNVSSQPSSVAGPSEVPAPAPATASHEPERVWLVAPARGQIEGEYALQKGRDRYGQPLWRQVNGAGWLFSSGPDGFWCFANNEADLGQRLGHVQSATPHARRSPNHVDRWQHHDGSAWHDDSTIAVVSSREEFEMAASSQQPDAEQASSDSSLWLLAPPYVALQGEYRKQENRTERGQPVYRQVGGEGWIFSTTKGRWFVTDGEAGIAVNGGVIATTTIHNGSSPHEMQRWQYFYEGSWHVDASIHVTAKQAEAVRRLAEQEADSLQRASAAPEKLWLICPPKPSLQGEYMRQAARIERGQAVWRQAGGNGILYSNGLGGLWCIATKEADVAKNLGLLQCVQPHKGKAPDEMEEWQFAEGTSWRADKSVRVTAQREEGQKALSEQETEALRRASAASAQLWLKAPLRPDLEGEYKKLEGKLERGQAIWCQANGPGWLYSTAGGRWFIADREDAVGLCGGVIASSSPHQSRYPQEMDRWQQYQDGSWKAAPSVQVLAERPEECFAGHIGNVEAQMAEDSTKPLPVVRVAMPSCLWVMASALPSLEGEYAQEKTRIMQGQCVWRKVGGASLFFNLQEGLNAITNPDGDATKARWCIAESEADAVGGVAKLRGGACHGGREPHETTAWERFDGNAWCDDSGVRVFLDSASFKSAVSERKSALKRKLLADTLQQAEDVEDDPMPEAVKPADGIFASVLKTSRPHEVDTSHSTDVAPANVLPQHLRERVATEVRQLLSRANLGQAHAKAQVNEARLIEECCSAVAQVEASGIDMTGENLSKEVMRTILVGWDSSSRRPNSLDDTVTPSRAISRNDISWEQDGVCLDDSGCVLGVCREQAL
eukprot:TRINITY_DN31255_c0_g1_i1.p1 TRINITY_DN31255_c0_g1~~TRINITY_DN31255_c0_g1_i1.p1  ORF type:complete len:896 (-),score=135.54 TRINITY_DN31255_c0_g1_i1:105-2642(-)